jgi:hypothetical protein
MTTEFSSAEHATAEDRGQRGSGWVSDRRHTRATA